MFCRLLSPARRSAPLHGWSGPSPVCSPITCGQPNNFSHGVYNGSQTLYEFNSALLALCEIGYNIITNNNPRVCEDTNQWTGNEPVCQIVECTFPSSVEHGSFSPVLDSYVYGAIITLICSAGYETENKRTTFTCLQNGTWGLMSLKCYSVRCNDTSDVQHDVVLGYPSVAFGQVAKVTYNSTFFNVKNGTLYVNCSSDRKLSWIIMPEFGEQ